MSIHRLVSLLSQLRDGRAAVLCTRSYTNQLIRRYYASVKHAKLVRSQIGENLEPPTIAGMSNCGYR